MTTPTPRPAFRSAAFIGGYAFVLMAVVAFALTADFGAKTSVARDTVQVAVLPAAIAPVVEAAIGASGTGKLTGVVQFEGNPPTFPPVVKKGDMTTKDPAVCAAQDVPYEELVVNPANKGIANVFIYLAKAPAGTKSAKPGTEPIFFDQKGCRFLPHGLIVPVGAQLMIQNGDPLLHNTHVTPQRNDGFNQSIGANDRKGVPLKYTKTEKLPVTVSCDVHPWMKAYHLVLDHSFAAITDADGKFEISDLPAGKHEFIVWQEKVGYLNRKYEVQIKDGEAKEVKLSFGSAKFAGFEGPQSKTIAVNVVP